jgi:hypothetical protein
VEHFAIIFLVFGIITLYLLSLASQPVFVEDYSDLSKYEGETVIIEGIVIDFDETCRGEGILTVLEPDDLESTLKIFIENNGRNFSIGNIIRAKGSVLKISEHVYQLVAMNDKDIENIGHWHSPQLSIPEIAHRLEHHPEEFKHLPVGITGYLKYEPRIPATSLRISEDPLNGFYTVKVDIPLSAQIYTDLHKGDLVSINVTIEYNENNFEYKLILKNITLLKQYGEWVVTLDEIQDAPFVYEGAKINTSGYIFNYESYYNYILLMDSPSDGRWDSNCSLWVDITGLNLTNVHLEKDYFVGIRGILYYDPQYFDYAIKAEEIFVG